LKTATAESPIEQADVELGKKLAQHRKDPVVRRAAEIGKLGDQEPLYTAGAILAFIGFVAGDRRLARAGISVVAAVAAADASKKLLKATIRRTRPHVLLDEGRYESDAGGSEKKPEQSFPSGHMAGSVAAARALSREFPRSGIPATLGAIIMGLARLAKGAHWPLDVAAGAVVGFIAEAVSGAVVSRLGVEQG